MNAAAAESAEVMRPRVVALFPPGTNLTGPFAVERLQLWTEKEPIASADRRPEVFGDDRLPVGAGQKTRVGSWQAFYGDENAPSNGTKQFCDDPGRREKYKRRNRGFWGGWNSLAGQLVTGIQPRSRWWYVRSFLALAPDGLHLFYAPCAKALSFDIAEGIETGPHIPRTQLAWIRHHKKETHFELGFTDGSWATLHLPDHEAFTSQVTGILPSGADRP